MYRKGIEIMTIGIILTPDTRSKAYLRKILDNNIRMDGIIFLNDGRPRKKIESAIIQESKKYGFNISQSVGNILAEKKINFKEFDFVDINNSILVDYLKKSKFDYLIFTGGGILKSEILNCGSRFIHFHPGIVPNYRGSTCFYYSIIIEGICGVTCYIMDENLDAGDIIFQKTFHPPTHRFVDEVYDPYIRAETLKEVLEKKIIEKGDFKKQIPNNEETYFIIHPVLKHIAILSCLK